MNHLLPHPALLQGLAFAHRAQRALRRRSTATRTAERHRNEFYDQAWREAAEQLGAEISPLAPSIHEIARDGVRTRVYRNYTPLDDPATLAIAGNKPLVYRLLAASKLPIPKYREFTLRTLPKAVAFLQQMQRPCVVKPAKDTGAGHGITTNVSSRWTLVKAATAAASYGAELLIEEQIPGDTYRLLYLDGVLLDAIVRKPPEVVADGRSTVRALVRRANAARVAGGPALSQTLLTIDLDMKRTLARQGLRLRSVPAAGTRVLLKTVANENAGPENASAKDLLCESVIQAGARAAEAVGARLAGVDVLTPDPSLPLAKAKGVILEVNTTPGYYYHYHQTGVPFPAALYILRRLLNVPPTVVARGVVRGSPDPAPIEASTASDAACESPDGVVRGSPDPAPSLIQGLILPPANLLTPGLILLGAF